VTGVFYQWQGDDLLLFLKVQPRANADRFGEILGERLKISITAAPVDGEANTRLCRFLARSFRVPRSAVQVLQGETSRHKTVRIEIPNCIPHFLPITHSLSAGTPADGF
jgi:uncharacterized protein (TIGR00251 family)